MRKYYASANMLLRKFSYCSPDVKCCMYKSYSATMYCSSMWFDSTVTSMKKLKIAYYTGLRRLLNLPKYNSASEMFVNLNIHLSMSCYEHLYLVLRQELLNLTTHW